MCTYMLPGIIFEHILVQCYQTSCNRLFTLFMPILQVQIHLTYIRWQGI